MQVALPSSSPFSLLVIPPALSVVAKGAAPFAV